jgi:hypothetical protein
MARNLRRQLREYDDTNIESATVQIRVNVESAFDVLAFTPQSGVATTGFNPVTGTLRLSGSATLAQYIAALESVPFFSDSNNPSPLTHTITCTVNNGTDPSAGATNQIAAIAVNDPPVVVHDTFDILGNSELRVDSRPRPRRRSRPKRPRSLFSLLAPRSAVMAA